MICQASRVHTTFSLLKERHSLAEQLRERSMFPKKEGKGGRRGVNGFCVLTYLLRNVETA